MGKAGLGEATHHFCHWAQQCGNLGLTAGCSGLLQVVMCCIRRHVCQCYELICFPFPQDAGHIESHTFATSTLTQFCILFKRTFITICRDQVGDSVCSVLYYSCARVQNL